MTNDDYGCLVHTLTMTLVVVILYLFISQGLSHDRNDVELLGNIFDNPELLEVKDE